MAKIVDKKKKRSEIAKAAIGVFAEKGFESSTVQEIADRAHIAKGTFYLYFKKKEDILNEASKEILQELEDEFLRPLNHLTDPVEMLSVLITEAMTITPEFEQFFVVYMEIRLFHLRHEKYGNFMKNFNDMMENLITIIVEIIEQGKLQGVFRKDVDVRTLTAYLFATLDGIIVHYLCDRSEFDIKGVTDEFLKNFLRGLEVRSEK